MQLQLHCKSFLVTNTQKMNMFFFISSKNKITRTKTFLMPAHDTPNISIQTKINYYTLLTIAELFNAKQQYKT